MIAQDSLDSQHFGRLQAALLRNTTSDRQQSDGQGSLHPDDASRNFRQSLVNTTARRVSLHSAPDMGAMLQESPIGDVDDARPNTFAGFENDGDTQPMPSQVYRSYQTMVRTNSSPDTLKNRGDNESTQAFTPAQNGLVDLMDVWDTQNKSKAEVHSIISSVEDRESQDFLSSLRRESSLKTPALSGRKRTRNGQTISPTTASKTPGSALSAFGMIQSRPLMTATQLFENTQAVSSPGFDVARSDPIESRPSPEFARIAGSPSQRRTSSPVRQMHGYESFAGGPRETYKRIDESQKRRSLLVNHRKRGDRSKVYFDLDDDGEDSQELARVAATSPTGRKDVIMELSDNSPAHSSDEEEDEDENGDGDRGEVDGEGDDDLVHEYDELAQEVFISQRQDSSQRVHGTPEMHDSDVEMDRPGSTSRSVHEESDFPRRDNIEDVEIIESTRPSQPVQNTQNTCLPPRPVDPSSMSSFVPASQVFSSQTRALLADAADAEKVSSLPHPPAGTETDQKDAKVPSSPPLGPRLDSVPMEVPRPLQGSSSIDDRLEKGSNEDRSTSTKEFATAPSHISGSQNASRSLSQSRRQVSESPLKTGGARRLGDIANDPTPPNSMGDIDLSIGMNLLSEKDRDFLDIVQSPRKASKVKIKYKRSPPRKGGQTHSAEVQETPAISKEPEASNTVTILEDSSPVVPARKRRKTRVVAESTTTEPEVVIHEADDSAVESDDFERNDSADPSQKEIMSQTPPGKRISSQKDIPVAVPMPTPDEHTDDSPSLTAGPGNHRVLALFNGSVNGYYPATCISAGVGPASKFTVRFDDGTCTALDRHLVCAFDLRVGDVVKVDLPKMRTHMYEVAGFDDTATSQFEGDMTDIHGHTKVQLILKRKDGARNKVAAAAAAIDRPVTVPTASIYITQTMWAKFNSRSYHHTSSVSQQQRQMTPSIDLSVPNTPSSRSRRLTLNSGHLPLSTSTMPLVPPSQSGTIFQNMAFAVSFKSDSQRDLLSTRLHARITAQSGQVLPQGLHELFSLPTSATTTTTLQLKPQYQNLGFVAVLADTHSRTQKYLQALALSLPVLHYKWAEDSLRLGSAQPWGRYLLPAGKSAYLNDAVRSRILAPYPVLGARLNQTLERREKPIDGAEVLLLASSSGGGKKEREGLDKRHVHAFLSIAMGASRTVMLDSVDGVKAIMQERATLREEHRRAVFVHCEQSKMASVVSALMEKGTTKPKGRKRANGDTDVEAESGRNDVTVSEGVRVVSDEWVIQSLILGA